LISYMDQGSKKAIGDHPTNLMQVPSRGLYMCRQI
jgi:hypothetical protein